MFFLCLGSVWFVVIVIPSGVEIPRIGILNVGIETLMFGSILGIRNFSVWLVEFEI